MSTLNNEVKPTSRRKKSYHTPEKEEKTPKKSISPIATKNSKQKTYPDVHSYINPAPPRKSKGFQDILNEEEETEGNQEPEQIGKSKSNFDIFENFHRRPGSLAQERSGQPQVSIADVNTTIKDFNLYSEVTLYSTLPFTWMNRIINYKESQQEGIEVPISELWSPTLPQEEMYSKLNSKLKQKMGFYFFSNSKVDSITEEEKSSLFQTYWSLWQAYTENNKRSFRLRSKASFLTFFQDSEHLKELLKKHNTKLLEKLILLKEQEASKSVEVKAPKLPETVHYAILGNLKGNTSLVKSLKNYGVNLHKIIDDDSEILAGTPSHFTIKKSTDNNYDFFLVYGRNVLTFFTYIVNQILGENLPFEVYSPFSFENCSVRHSQVIHNNYVVADYEKLDEVDCMVDKLSSDQSVPINRECEELAKYKIFGAASRTAPKTYQLVLRGAFFGHRLKELVRLFAQTQRGLKMKAVTFEASNVE